MKPFDPRLTVIAAQARVKTCHVFHCWQAIRDLGRGFHVGAFAHFTGLEVRHVEAILSALAANDAMPAGRAPCDMRGNRLPADWTLPADWSAWASAERRWHPDDVAKEAETFADYWHSRPGQGGIKLDWRKTWQNWCRNSRRPEGDYQPDRPMVANRDHMERTASLYERMGRENEALEIRRQLASQANVIPFNQPLKMAQN